MATTHLEKFLVQQMRCGLIPIPDPPHVIVMRMMVLAVKGQERKQNIKKGFC